MSTITKLDDGNYVSMSQDSSVHYFEIAGRNASNEGSNFKEDFHNWEANAIDLEGWKVLPNGSSNDMPKKIQEATLPNSIAPRIQNRKVELLLDQFPYLFEIDKGVRVPIDEPEIIDWLQSFNYIDVLIENATDYYYSNIVFSKIFLQKGTRLIGSSESFAKIESVSSFEARFAYRSTDSKKKPTHIIVGDWYANNEKEKFQIYPIFDPQEPLKYPVSIHVSTFKTYGMKYYPLPEIYGAIPWIKRNSSIPEILKSLTDNSLNIKWHITSPDSFWEAKRKALQDKCKSDGVLYQEKMLDDLRSQILGRLTELLSGVENVGKFWHNVETTKIIGASAHTQGWSIKPIEQKVKDYVTAQLEIALSSAKFVMSSLGLHAALANVGADGKSDSGSEQIYAFKIHQFTSTRLPEYYVCKALNDIIKVKYGPNIYLGFAKAKIDTESDTTPSRRMKNQED